MGGKEKGKKREGKGQGKEVQGTRESEREITKKRGKEGNEDGDARHGDGEHKWELEDGKGKEF
jgi:hypothetical protein